MNFRSIFMDFDLNFGRFFGVKIDSFGKAESSENVPPKEIWTPKKRDFPQGKCYFLQNRRFLLWRGNRWKTWKEREKIASKSMFVLTCIFWGFWSQLGWILASKLGLKSAIPLDTFPSCVQESSKTRPRVPQERPKSAQECPKSAPRVPKSAPKPPQPGAPQERP